VSNDACCVKKAGNFLNPFHTSRIPRQKIMKNTKQLVENESDKPQWWQRFSRLLPRRGLPRLTAPRFSGHSFQHSELVVRNFPPAFGKALQAGPE